jgi:hypothetical protein
MPARLSPAAARPYSGNREDSKRYDIARLLQQGTAALRSKRPPNRINRSQNQGCFLRRDGVYVTIRRHFPEPLWPLEALMFKTANGSGWTSNTWLTCITARCIGLR